MGSGSTLAAAHLDESLFFCGVPDDILINILCRLDEDPRDLARLACVSTRFCKIIKTVCWKFKCEKTLPLLVAELLQSPSPALHPCREPPGGWASLQKLLVCCPGLWHAGVLLENWDFGLDREIGWFDDFGYPDGPSHLDGLITPKSIIPELGFSHTCESVGNKSRDRIYNLVPLTCTVECDPNGSGTCMVLPDVNDVKTHVSCDVCGLDSVNSCTHYSEAGMSCNGNAGGIDCEKEADMGGSAKEMGMYKSECDDKRFLTHVGHNEIGLALGVGINYDNDIEGLMFVKTEVAMENSQCNKAGNKLGCKHCHKVEKSMSKVMNRVAEGCHVRNHEFEESAEEKDGAVVAMKEGAPQIYKSMSMQLWPTLLNDDTLNLRSLEAAGCRHQSKEDSDLVETHVNQIHIASSRATSDEKRKQERRPKSADLVETHVNQMNIASSCATLDEKRKREHRPKSHKRRRKCQNGHCHVATRPWNLSREQGNKLLANRFRADSLYICDWPGCSHPGDKRIYKLFRGVFKNFKHTHVWRNLKDMQAKATNVGCAFCVCKSTWDMVTTFCLKRSIEYHDDGEPVVRAYVCENGHVAGAWTDRPMYTL